MVTRRIFVVGCPRSGTTLVQGLLAAHPDLVTFPETHFFTTIHPLNRFRALAGWPSLRATGAMAAWAARAGRPDLAALDPVRPWSRDSAAGFRRVLDAWADAAGARGWIEKTPAHVYRIGAITRAVPDARFIHVVRDGRETVASLHDVARRHPAVWRSRYRFFGARGLTVDECVLRWNRAMACTAAVAGNPAHLIVRYEAVVADPRAAIGRMCSFIGLPWPGGAPVVPPGAGHILADEEWKRDAMSPPGARPPRFDEAFPPRTRDRVLRRLRAFPRVEEAAA